MKHAGKGQDIDAVERRGERIVILRRGVRVAAVVPVEDIKLLERIEDGLGVKAALEALKQPGGLSPAAVKKKLRL